MRGPRQYNRTDSMLTEHSASPPDGGRGEALLKKATQIPPRLVIAAAVLIHLALSLWAMAGDSCTYDEGVHLSTGYLALTRGDFRITPEHPPLAKVFSALPILGLGARLPENPEVWKNRASFDYGFQFLYQAGNDADRLLFWGRVPTLLWSTLLVVSVYGLAAELYGAAGGLIALVLALFYPNFLAHGHLATADIAVTTLVLLTVAAARLLFRSPTPLRALACGVLLGGALVAKFSGIFVLPILLVLGVAEGLQRRSSAPAANRIRAVGCLLLVPASAFVLIWACYRFRYSPAPDPSVTFSWDLPRFNEGAAARLVDLARTYHLLPEAFLHGLALTSEMSAGRDAYALGVHSTEGWWWYFPFAFLVKTPVATLALLGWGLVEAMRRYSRGFRADEFLLVSMIVFWVIAVRSSMNIGIRHILPVHPFMLILAGGVAGVDAPAPWTRGKVGAVSGLLGTAVAGCLWAAPCFLAYFNLPSRIIDPPRFLLTDSNLDWGQDLGRLKRYMDRHGISEVKLAYHGSASPRHLQLRHQVLPGLTWFTQYLRQEPEWKTAAEVHPGDYVAVSATTLVGLVLSDKDLFLRTYGSLKPVAEIGGSIFLYRIPDRAP